MITAEDAVREVWEQFLEGRMLCVPEMGEPKRILDIMTEVLGKHGYKKGSDYTPGVELIGMRRGEKLHEKLIWDHERR
jgi:FlaA1/EpsC-like NDP-sugar epimerase